VPKTKVAITLDAELLDRVNELRWADLNPDRGREQAGLRPVLGLGPVPVPRGHVLANLDLAGYRPVGSAP